MTRKMHDAMKHLPLGYKDQADAKLDITPQQLREKVTGMNTKRAVSMLIASGLAVVSQHVTALNLTDTLFDQAGEQYQLDPLLIYSVALVESASGRGSGYVSPWAWTLRAPKTAFYGVDQPEVEKQLSEFIEEYGENIDVGYMQISIKWHGDRVDSPHDLLDPRTNIFLGSDILKTAMDSAPDDLALGIGRYHHWADENRSRSYGKRVLRIYEELKQL